MLSARIKAIFVLLFSTIVIMAVTVKNTPPVSEYMQTGIRLSDLPDLERTEFMVAKGATAVPYNYKTSAGFQELTTDLVAEESLEGKIKKGDSVTLDAADDKLVLTHKDATASTETENKDE